MAGTDKEFVTKLKQAIDLVAFVSETIQLKRSGKYFSGLSPFTKEKTPSFFVNPERQTYHCFSTDQGGDLIDFVMATKGFGFREALEFLAQRAGIPMEASNKTPEQIARDRQIEEERKLFFKLNRFAARFYQEQFEGPVGGVARDYAQKRAISTDSLLAFGIGYAPDSWTALRDYFIKIQAPLLKAYDLGLFRTKGGEKPKSDGSNLFDTFRNRLIFPIRDVAGEVLGFGGRWLGASGTDAPKYINSPESVVYEKDKVLYNLDLARKPIRDSESVVLVEGYMDCLSLVQAGFSNAVANCGTALTKTQAGMLRKLAPRVICLYDSDGAGQAAMEKAMALFLETEGYPLLGAQLPEGKDPDEFLRTHGEAGKIKMASILQESPAILDLWIEKQLAQSPRTLQGRAETVDKIALKIAKLKEDLWVQARLPGISKELGVETDFVVGAVRKYRKGFGQEMGRPIPSSGPHLRPIETQKFHPGPGRKGKQIQGPNGKKDVGFERRFLGELLKQPSWIATLRERQESDSVLSLVENPDFRLVLEKILEPLGAGQSEEEHVEEALEVLRDQPRLRGLFAESTLRWDDELLSSDLEGALARLREDGLKRRAAALQREIEEAEKTGDETRSDALLVQLMELRRKREQR